MILFFSATVEMLKQNEIRRQYYFHCRQAKPPAGAPPLPSSLLAASQAAREMG